MGAGVATPEKHPWGREPAVFGPEESDVEWFGEQTKWWLVRALLIAGSVALVVAVFGWALSLQVRIALGGFCIALVGAGAIERWRHTFPPLWMCSAGVGMIADGWDWAFFEWTEVEKVNAESSPTPLLRFTLKSGPTLTHRPASVRLVNEAFRRANAYLGRQPSDRFSGPRVRFVGVRESLVGIVSKQVMILGVLVTLAPLVTPDFMDPFTMPLAFLIGSAIGLAIGLATEVACSRHSLVGQPDGLILFRRWTEVRRIAWGDIVGVRCERGFLRNAIVIESANGDPFRFASWAMHRDEDVTAAKVRKAAATVQEPSEAVGA